MHSIFSTSTLTLTLKVTTNSCVEFSTFHQKLVELYTLECQNKAEKQLHIHHLTTYSEICICLCGSFSSLGHHQVLRKQTLLSYHTCLCIFKPLPQKRTLHSYLFLSLSTYLLLLKATLLLDLWRPKATSLSRLECLLNMRE